jgi:hypothetical protein
MLPQDTQLLESLTRAAAASAVAKNKDRPPTQQQLRPRDLDSLRNLMASVPPFSNKTREQEMKEALENLSKTSTELFSRIPQPLEMKNDDKAGSKRTRESTPVAEQNPISKRLKSESEPGELKESITEEVTITPMANVTGSEEVLPQTEKEPSPLKEPSSVDMEEEPPPPPPPPPPPAVEVSVPSGVTVTVAPAPMEESEPARPPTPTPPTPPATAPTEPPAQLVPPPPVESHPAEREEEAHHDEPEHSKEEENSTNKKKRSRAKKSPVGPISDIVERKNLRSSAGRAAAAAAARQRAASLEQQHNEPQQ